MDNSSNYGFATRQIHAGKSKDFLGALHGPIYQTASFRFDSVQQGGARFAGEDNGYIYTRLGNPTQRELEARVASLEEGEAALATGSGMGAITSAIWSSIESGGEILADETLYGCTFAFFNHGLDKFGIKTVMADMTKPENIKAYLNPNTKIVYLESPCNPTLKIIDIAEISRITHEYNPDIKVIVDNTFSSPYLQKPLTLGADVVVHSATKYLNGHGDVIAGFVVGREEFINRCLMFGVKDMTGAVISPFDAYMVIRGLKTLDIRMERHCENARKLAEFLRSHPAVRKVHYPGFADFPDHAVAKKQMKGFGGMISIELVTDRLKTAEAVNKLELVTLAVSLGDTETLVEHPATMTHSVYTAEELEAAKIPASLLRISVGLENIEDVISDFKNVLDEIKK